MSAFVDLISGTFAMLALLLPGWLITRNRGIPLPALAGFVIGLIVLVLLVQLLPMTGGKLSLPLLGTVWGVITILAYRFRAGSLPSAPAKTVGQGDWLLLLPTVPAILTVAYRAVAQPLSGVDTIFRWNYLAELMLAQGSLDFYPPSSAADYALYGWADGIAPAVATLYFWSYLLAGEARAILTAPAVLIQFILLLAACWTLTRQHANPRAAAFACALLAASPLVLWGIAMGQETGLLILSLCGLLLYLPAAGEEPRALPVMLAGACAALGGLAREYGLSYIALGAVLILFRRHGSRLLLLFLITSLGCVLPWYLRNWIRTDNPLFNLDLAGIFPVNAAHIALMDTYRQHFGWQHLPDEALRLFLIHMWVPLLALGLGFGIGWRVVRPWFGPFVLVFALWAVALELTAAGFSYALRVLAPGAAVAACVGGIALARWLPGKKNLSLTVIILGLLAGDACLRALVLPGNPYRLSPATWLTVGGAAQEYHAQPFYAEMARQTAGHRLLVLGPNALLNRQGAETVPLWSPEVAYLWDDSIGLEEAAAKLTAARINYVLLGKGPVNQAYLSRIPFFRRKVSRVLQFAWGSEDLILFRVVPPLLSPQKN